MLRVKYEPDEVASFLAPKQKLLSYRPEEIRIEVPFPQEYDSFLYISKFWNEKWITPAQYHDHFELCYVIGGSGWFMLEGDIVQVTRGDIFITKPNEVHSGGAAGNSEFMAYALGFRFDQMRSLEQAFYQLGAQRITRDDQGIVMPYLDRMLGEIERAEPYAHVLVRAELMAMLVWILRLYQSKQMIPQTVKPLSPEIIKLLNLVHTPHNYMGEVDQLAQLVNMSRATLDREFKKQMGQPLGDYIRGIWLERGKQLLRESSESITQIAETLQFDSVQAFCLFFKRQTGLSPQRFRKLIVEEIC